MIVREWRGRASRANREAYPGYFRRKLLAELESTESLLGATLENEAGEQVEFVVLTRWAAMSAIAGFAGRDPDRAVVEPEAVAALLSFDSLVRHYRVLEDFSD